MEKSGGKSFKIRQSLLKVTSCDIKTHIMSHSTSRLPLTKAAGFFPENNGKKVSVSAMRRWILTGDHGVRLQAVYVAHRWYTTEEWVHQFIESTTSAVVAKAVPVAVPNSAERDEEKRRSAEQLKKWGIDVGHGRKTQQGSLPQVSQASTHEGAMSRTLRKASASGGSGRHHRSGRGQSGEHPAADAARDATPEVRSQKVSPSNPQ
jgi:hypothetical protein